MHDLATAELGYGKPATTVSRLYRLMRLTLGEVPGGRCAKVEQEVVASAENEHNRIDRRRLSHNQTDATCDTASRGRSIVVVCLGDLVGQIDEAVYENRLLCRELLD